MPVSAPNTVTPAVLRADVQPGGDPGDEHQDQFHVESGLVGADQDLLVADSRLLSRWLPRRQLQALNSGR